MALPPIPPRVWLLFLTFYTLAAALGLLWAHYPTP